MTDATVSAGIWDRGSTSSISRRRTRVTRRYRVRNGSRSAGTLREPTGLRRRSLSHVQMQAHESGGAPFEGISAYVEVATGLASIGAVSRTGVDC